MEEYFLVTYFMMVKIEAPDRSLQFWKIDTNIKIEISITAQLFFPCDELQTAQKVKHFTSYFIY